MWALKVWGNVLFWEIVWCICKVFLKNWSICLLKFINFFIEKLSWWYSFNCGEIQLLSCVHFYFVNPIVLYWNQIWSGRACGCDVSEILLPWFTKCKIYLKKYIFLNLVPNIFIGTILSDTSLWNLIIGSRF